MNRWILSAMAGLIVCSGCASGPAQRLAAADAENDRLKARVAALETQVAELKAQVDRSKSISAVMIDGYRLEPPRIGELRFAPAPGQSTSSGTVLSAHTIIGYGSTQDRLVMRNAVPSTKITTTTTPDGIILKSAPAQTSSRPPE